MTELLLLLTNGVNLVVMLMSLLSVMLYIDLIGLQTIDERVFGHIQDWTLSEAGVAALSLLGISDSKGKKSSISGENITLGLHCKVSSDRQDSHLHCTHVASGCYCSHKLVLMVQHCTVC